ncbi:MAG: short-chain fatty acid transporter [Candidatus Sericytochromatia bacterium]|nr:short-chain fatty acid transporter [Candidatus Sericytochromatia bacterium]
MPIAHLFQPLLLACLLNLLVGLAAWVLTPSGPVAILNSWSQGFGSLMGFAMQMVLMLLLGHVLASATWVYARLQALARWLSLQRGTAFWIVVLSAAISWLHWGLGLVAGALIAREVARSQPNNSVARLRYTAAAYAGFIVWHGGWSGSAPLVVATPKHNWASSLGVIPVSETLLSPLNLCLLLGIILTAALSVQFLPVKAGQLMSAAAEPEQSPPVAPQARSWDYVLPTGWLMVILTACLLLSGQQSLNLNTVILLLFGLSFALHRHSTALQQAVSEGLGETAGVVLQFPLYGALMGMMQDSGLAVMLSEQLLTVATPATFLPLAFLSAGVLNFLVPSGGGQWAVQAPVLIPVAQSLQADMGQMVIAFAWGDTWTNLIQPFWALPLLAITRVQALDLLRLSSKVCLLTGIVASLIFYGFGA